MYSMEQSLLEVKSSVGGEEIFNLSVFSKLTYTNEKLKITFASWHLV
jgi:hypothetical protein